VGLEASWVMNCHALRVKVNPGGVHAHYNQNLRWEELVAAISKLPQLVVPKEQSK
jgi:hypothetical protein